MAAFPSRQRRGSKHGQPAWLITFADLMTLLLTFFILLLSFSEIDAEKYRAMIQSMAIAFGNSGDVSLIRFEGSPAAPVVESAMSVPEEPAAPELLPALDSGRPVEPSKVDPGIENLAAVLVRQLEADVARENLAVNYDQRRVVVRFAEDATFPSGTAQVKPAIRPIIDEIVSVLAQCTGDVIVSGHSDDRPIASSRYRSNWDLSAARAVSVVHQLVMDKRLDAGRVMAAGHAETRPLVPNTTSDNRALNRRVEISIYEPQCAEAPGARISPGDEQILPGG